MTQTSRANAAEWLNGRMFLLCTSLAFGNALPAQQQQKLVAVPPAKLQSIQNKLDIKLLPDGGHKMEVDNNQVFQLILKGAPLLTIVPVRFETARDESIEYEQLGACGVYLVPEKGYAVFIRMNEELAGEVDACGVDAMGISPVSGSNPSVILIDGVCQPGPGGCARSYPVILSWNKGEAAYEVNQSLSGDAEEEFENPTVSNVRQFLSKQRK